MQMIKEMTRTGTLLDLILTNEKELVRTMKTEAATAAVTMK